MRDVEIRLWLGIIPFTTVKSYSTGEGLDYDLSKPLTLLEIFLKRTEYHYIALASNTSVQKPRCVRCLGDGCGGEGELERFANFIPWNCRVGDFF